MIHFIPESLDGATPLETPGNAGPYAEAVARLASIHRALACVEQAAGAAPSTRDSEARLALGFPAAPDAAKRCFEARSARTASAAAAGLEAIAALDGAANPAAIRALADALNDGLDEIDMLFSL
jgi:hypothetical protein